MMLFNQNPPKHPSFSGRVVFVADVFDETTSNAPKENRRDMEKSTPATISAVMKALDDAKLDPVHVENPTDLLDYLDGHEGDLVLSTYGGEFHRSRTAHIPALCESLEVAFIGLDAFGQIICHNKETAKDLAKSLGLSTPNWRVFRPGDPLDLLTDFPTPYILKPLSEGSSIGISNANIIRHPDDGPGRGKALIDDLQSPIIAEAFIAGREVAFSALQTDGEPLWGFNELQVIDDPDFYKDHVWDAAEKYNMTIKRQVVPIEDELHADDRKAILRFLKALGDFDYIRIDGRLSGGRFQFIEATPDAYLGPHGQLAKAFGDQGLSYPDMFTQMVRSALSRLPDQSAIG